MKKIIKIGNVVGIISTVFFLFCITWGLILTDAVLVELHRNILRVAYPGFSMSFVGIIICIILAFIYGWFFGSFFVLLCKKFSIYGQDIEKNIEIKKSLEEKSKTKNSGSCCS
jgi:uncharacterized protein YacL